MNGGVAYVDKREFVQLQKRLAELERFNEDLAQESYELQTLLSRASERFKEICAGLSKLVDGKEVTDPLAQEIDAYLKKFE